MITRTLIEVIPSVAASDGAGVKLRRSIGSSSRRLDPFLMLDEFGTDRPEDYIAGFPPHPHRGFETVTYMIDGHMQHKDHMGNIGELTEGGVQWMTAGRGVIHSEMPQQENGRMRGFQLWINLPAAEKMKPAAYRDIPADDLPLAEAGDVRVKVIAGILETDAGPVIGTINGLTTEPLFFDLVMPPDSEFAHAVAENHNAFVYPYEGTIFVGPDRQNLPRQAAGVLSPGNRIMIRSSDTGARVILLAGKPLGEPVVQYGPFVMNTREEIDQAVADYQNGTLV